MKFSQLSTRAANGTGGRRRPFSGQRTLGINPGLWTIPIATAASIFLLPLDPSEPGALMLPAWILTIGILAAIGIDVMARGYERLFRAEHVILMAVVIVVYPEILQPYYACDLNSEIVKKVFLAIGAFGTSVALGSSFRPPRLARTVIDLAKRQYSAKLVFRLLVSCWALAMFNVAFASDFSLSTMMTGLLAGRWDSPWSRGQLGGWDAFLDFLTYFGHLVPMLTVVLALRLGSWVRSRVIIGVVCSCMCVAFMAQGGGRRLIVVVLGSALLTWVFVKRRQLRPKHIIVIAALAVGTMVFLEVVLQVRKEGFGTLAESNGRPEIRGLHVDNNFSSLGEILRVIPAETDFVGFPYLFYIIVRPIPRIFWENKPIGYGFDLAQHLGQQGVAIALSTIGELYMSFGWLGIIMGGAALGWLARFWSQLIEKDYGLVGTALYALGAMTFFLGIRSLIELILMTYPILCWYGLDRLMWKWVQRKRARPSRVALLPELESQVQ